MFDSGAALSAKDIESLADALRLLDGEAGDVERVDQLAALERLKSSIAAAQARVTAAFIDSQEQVAADWRARADECSAEGDFEGWRAAREQARRASLEPERADSTAPGREIGRAQRSARRSRNTVHGVAAQVALARRESPSKGSQHVRLALTLTQQMPGTLAALETGRLSEWRAGIVVRESAGLDAAQLAVLDDLLSVELASEGGALATSGDRELARRVRAIAYRLAPRAIVERSSRAHRERRVTLRPAPDTMAYLTALLPVAEAVATHAALTSAADAARAAGDERGKGQVMADTLVERVTGQQSAPAVPVEVQLVMTDRALLTDSHDPAHLNGYGTVPAAWARQLVDPNRDPTPGPAGGSRARVWLRRLYTDPTGRDLVAMESARRVFDGGLRRFILTRDAGTCRTPWCDAPARHIDHIHPYADGGPTAAANAQALCIRCNHTKEEPGWTAIVAPPPPGQPLTHHVITTTPTGHQYSASSPPLLPGHPPDLSPSGADARAAPA